MEEPKFISHSQLAPPTTVPRQGLGLFSVLAIVVAVLALAFTGGLFLLKQSNEQQKTALIGKLKELRDESEIASLKNIKSIQERISAAKAIIDGHVYSSQAFVFAERHTLSPVQIKTFEFSKEGVRMELNAPGYLEFAQQIKYYRDSDLKGIVKSFAFKPPVLGEEGRVGFAVEVTFTPEYLRTKPSAVRIETSNEPPAVPRDEIERSEEEL